MKVVIDTNVLAYFLLRTQPYYEEVRSFWRRAAEAWAPDSWRVEFLNVLWLGVRQGVLEAGDAQRRLRLAEGLVTHTCSVADVKSAALRLAIQHSHPACDTVFLALAIRENAPLATYDRKLLESFPNWTRRPGQFP